MSRPCAQHDGESTAEAFCSPGARYVQYRVTLPAANRSCATSRSTTCRRTSARASPRSTSAIRPRRPRRRTGLATPRRRRASAARAHSPTLKLRWKVENPDGDELIYRLWFRQEGDAVWRPLGGPDPLTKPEYDWNTDSVPDGRYVVRVWASDEKVDARRASALDHVFESPPFLVDNPKPEILGLGRARPRSRHRPGPRRGLGDLRHRVRRRRRRVAAGPPDDGLLDERDEAFTLRLAEEPLGPGRTSSTCAPGTPPTTSARPASKFAAGNRAKAAGARERATTSRPWPSPWRRASSPCARSP